MMDEQSTCKPLAPLTGAADNLARHQSRVPLAWGRPLLLLLAFLGLAASGCGRPREVLGPVSGRVTFRGQPVREGIIMFHNREKGVYINAPLDADGRYTVEMAGGYGLPLGTYQVALSPPLLEQPLGPLPERTRMKEYPNIPPRYRNPQTSGLTLTVKEGSNVFDVDLKP